MLYEVITNVRSGPDSSKPIIAVLNKNKWVNILAKIGEWYAIYDPETGIVGCVHGNFIGTADDAKAGIPSTQNPPTVTVITSYSIHYTKLYDREKKK